MVKNNLVLTKEKIIKYFINLLNKIFTVISINKSPFKGISFGILLLFGIITSIIIRIDFLYKILDNIPYELMFSLRITSGLYSILLIFLLMVTFKYTIEFIKIYFNNYNNLSKSLLFLYLLYILYVIFISLFLINVNYYSIISLNINELIIIYFVFTVISLIYGIYFAIYLNIQIDLNRSLSNLG